MFQCCKARLASPNIAKLVFISNEEVKNLKVKYFKISRLREENCTDSFL